ncbi:MAG: alpha/beta fold hydrolase [Methyloligellaceae bacterium]
MGNLTPLFAWADIVRRSQGEVLRAFGYGPEECSYRVLASGAGWRLRHYDGPAAGPALLIVAAPIKRPYIWDLTPSVSTVRTCLDRGIRTFLLEWTRPSPGEGIAHLADYADSAIGDAVAQVSQETGGAKPFLIGHSLGGTLAAIYGALQPDSLQGLVLLSAPLCFRPDTGRFRDAIVSLAPSSLSEFETVSGSLLSQLSAVADPQTFVWSRLMDRVSSIGNPRASDLQARIEHWALDEVALPGALVDELLNWLYREDRFTRGSLSIQDRMVGPSDLDLPALAVVNAADDIVPMASVLPFLKATRGNDISVLTYDGETGVGLQHLGILLGRNAHAQIWPEILAWINDRHRELEPVASSHRGLDRA